MSEPPGIFLVHPSPSILRKSLDEKRKASDAILRESWQGDSKGILKPETALAILTGVLIFLAAIGYVIFLTYAEIMVDLKHFKIEINQKLDTLNQCRSNQ